MNVSYLLLDVGVRDIIPTILGKPQKGDDFGAYYGLLMSLLWQRWQVYKQD